MASANASPWLSEDGTKQVLLLEAGPDYGPDPADWPEAIALGQAPGPGRLEGKTAGSWLPWGEHNWLHKGESNVAGFPNGGFGVGVGAPEAPAAVVLQHAGGERLTTLQL